MKKNILYYLCAILCTVCLFTACSDDDITIDDVTGTYRGNLSISALAQTMPTSVVVEKAGDNQISVGINSLEITGIKLDPIRVICTLRQDGDDFDLSGSGTVQITGIGELPISVSGDIDGRELDIDIHVAQIPLIGNLSIEFEGNR